MRTLADILFATSMLLSVILFTILIFRNVYEIKRSKEFWNSLKEKNKELINKNNKKRKVKND